VTKHKSHIGFKEFSKILTDINGKYDDESLEEKQSNVIFLRFCFTGRSPIYRLSLW
jgi:hypothetical protein